MLGIFGFTKIGVNPDLTGIVPEKNSEYKKLISFLREKSSSNVLIVVLHSSGMVDKGKEALKKLMDEFLKSGYVKEALRFDTPEIFVKYGIFISGGREGITNILEVMNKGVTKKSPADFGLWRGLGTALKKLEDYAEGYIRRKGFNEYVLVSPDGNAMVMNFALKVDVTNVEQNVEAVENLKKISERIEGEYGFEIDFTGSPMSTYESHKAVKTDFLFTTVFSLASISVLLYLTIGGFLNVAYLFLSMLVAMSLSMGSYYFIFGEINIVTSFINAMILGLGIDFGIHILTRFTHFAKKLEDTSEALQRSFEETLHPSLFSALTTIAAFITTSFSGSKAFIQMGLMASMGIGIFFITMYIFLPSLLIMKRGKSRDFKLYDFVVRSVDHIRKRNGAFVTVLILSLFLGYWGFENFKNFWYTPPGLIPETSESYRTYKFLEREFPGFGTGDVVLGVTDFESLKKITDKLREDPMFSKVTSIVTIFEGLSKKSAEKFSRYYGPLSEVIRNPLLATLLRKVGVYQETLEMLKIVREAGNFEKIMREIEKDLPMFFFEYNGNRYYLIYAKSNLPIYENNNLKRVYDHLNSSYSDAEFFGYSALLYRLMETIRKVITKIIFMIGATVFIIILASTLSLSETLKMVFVMILFVFSTLGLIYFWHIRVSFMTLLVVPIMIGIGVDAMIHLSHSVKKSRETIVKTEKAVSISTLTTALAFGSFSFSRGQLLREFGISVAAGLLVSLILAIFVFLPMVDRRDESG